MLGVSRAKSRERVVALARLTDRLSLAHLLAPCSPQPSRTSQNRLIHIHGARRQEVKGSGGRRRTVRRSGLTPSGASHSRLAVPLCTSCTLQYATACDASSAVNVADRRARCTAVTGILRFLLFVGAVRARPFATLSVANQPLWSATPAGIVRREQRAVERCSATKGTAAAAANRLCGPVASARAEPQFALHRPRQCAPARICRAAHGAARGGWPIRCLRGGWQIRCHLWFAHAVHLPLAVGSRRVSRPARSSRHMRWGARGTVIRPALRERHLGPAHA